jgi:multicomponent Na+:H+ antiporter subunit E
VTRKWPLTGVVLAVLWLFVRGVTAGPDFTATLSNVGGEFLIGLLVGWPTAYALRRYYADEFAVEGNLRVVPAALAFLGTFLYELLTANVDVAYRVLAPSMPIDPDVVAVPLRVESDIAITTIANSITLTPGTLTMDHDAETNTLYVHAIAAEDLESVLGPIRQWEDSALIVFEGRDPDLEVPRRGYMDTERIAEATTAARADSGDHGGESGGR